MHTKRIRRRLLAVGVAAGFLAAACSGGGDEADDTTPPTEAAATTTEAPETTTTEASTTTSTTTTSTTTTTLPEEPLRQPLTGEVVESEDDLVTRPALAVKIDNSPAGRRNHTGLAVADIVYEEIVEAQITRFAAVFHTQDADPVGPVRSGRSQDVDILSSYNQPLFAWSGGNPGVTRFIRESLLTDLNWQRNVGSYYRGPGPSPQNLYSSTETLYGLTPEDHPGPPPPQFVYVGPTFAAPDGRAVESFDLDMRSIDVEWRWDTDRERWIRLQEGDFHVDTTYGQIGAENVIVMVVEYDPSRFDARSPEAQTLGRGIVYVFSDGQVVEGIWERELAVGQVRIETVEGDPIPLQPGQTWIELAEFDEDAGEGVSPTAIEIRFAPDADDDAGDDEDATDDSVPTTDDE